MSAISRSPLSGWEPGAASMSATIHRDPSDAVALARTVSTPLGKAVCEARPATQPVWPAGCSGSGAAPPSLWNFRSSFPPALPAAWTT